MSFYVYLIRNQINGKIYVGESHNPQHRWQQHCWTAKNENKSTKDFTYFHRAIRKYGEDNFILKVVGVWSSETEALMHETEWIETLKDFGCILYNLTKGGEGSSGYKHTEEAKIKMSQFHSGKILKEETKNKISNSLKGRKRSLNAIEKCSLSLQGHKIPENVKNKISTALKGKIIGENHSRAKLTERNALDILELRKRGFSLKEIASKFGVDKTTIGDICRGKTWTHLLC